MSTGVERRMERLENKVDSLASEVKDIKENTAGIITELKHIVTYDDVKDIVDEKIKLHTATCAPYVKKQTSIDNKLILKIILAILTLIASAIAGHQVTL